MKFSVLISLYCKENPVFLRESLNSIFHQTLLPDEIILVEDGPLTPELYAVVEDFAGQHVEIKRVHLEKNVGLGLALNEGLRHCSCELVARMDTDDVAKPERFAKQVDFMARHPDIAVCGSWIDEFIGTTDNVVSYRRIPETPEELAVFGRKRNPLNHPSVMFRKHAVEAVGGYEHFPLFEDYWLWARMQTSGYLIYNLQESLLWFRTSADVYRRRGGWRYATTELRFQYSLWRIGYISFVNMVYNGATRFFVRILPNTIRKILYNKMVRK